MYIMYKHTSLDSTDRFYLFTCVLHCVPWCCKLQEVFLRLYGDRGYVFDTGRTCSGSVTARQARMVCAVRFHKHQAPWMANTSFHFEER